MWRCRTTLVSASVLTLALLVAGCTNGGGLSSDVRRVVDAPLFANSPWAIQVADLESGEVLESLNPEWMLDPASTTKLFTIAATMDTLGKDYRFKTPVVATGDVGSTGTLEGDLVLVAGGDISLGGRTLPGGKIEYTNMDHTDANALGNCQLTKTDPLAGLDDLARQVAASGVKAVRGDVIIDTSLYGPVKPFNPDAGYVLWPIMVNDNLIDIIVQPGAQGAPAQVDYRPKSAAYRVESAVATGAKDSDAELEISSSIPGVISVKGQVPQGNQVVNTYSVDDPPAFARTCFVEALARAGVSVSAPVTGANPALSEDFNRQSARQVAVLDSPPFSEYGKLLMKVSHNPGADTCILLMAAKNGKKTMADGLIVEGEFLKKAGVASKGVVINDGQGSAGADFIAPSAAITLLRYMSKRPDFKEFFATLPVMGVDGTLATLMTDSPVKGKAQAKTGTHGGPNQVNQGMWVSRALAGYMTAKSGRKLVYDIVVSNVPAGGMKDMQSVNAQHGKVLEVIYDRY
ncbi:MAG: D-alanyl-D-alanine carboxypeptidase/D-alanyl-D-alanine endopeptidase [Candidatus Geothermincolia bacterium]